MKNWAVRMRAAGKSTVGYLRAQFTKLTVLGISLILVTSDYTQAQEIAPFKIMDVSGTLKFRYLLNDRSSESGTNMRRSESTIWQELLGIQARAYIYHPGLLTLSLSGGPALVQSSYKAENNSTGDESTVFDLSLSMAFLSYRPYPFNLYYSRSFPQTSSGLSGSFTTKNQGFGASGSFQPMKSRFDLGWSAGRYEASGAGTGAKVDDVSDSFQIRALLPLGKGEDVSISISRSDRLSKSGNVGLPIQDSRITTSRVELSNDFGLGSSDQIGFKHNLLWNRTDTALATTTRQDRLNYRANMSWKYSDKTDYSGSLYYTDVDRGDSWSKSSNVSFGLSHNLSNGISMSGGGGAGRSESSGFASDNAALSASASYFRPLSFGRLKVNAALGLRQTGQESSVDFISVFDEVVMLAGTDAVTLSKDFIVASTIVVTNSAKTQTYVEGLDYRLFVIGGTTSIERLITGNIDEGQTVLVSYEFQSGGTVEYGSFSQNVGLSLSMFKHIKLGMTFNNVENKISEGFANTPISSSRGVTLRANVGYPLGNRWRVGGSYVFSDNYSDITSSVSSNSNVFAVANISGGATLQLGVQNFKRDNADSPEDVEMLGFTVALAGRLTRRWFLNYSGRYSQNKGGTDLREELRHDLRLNWGYRLVRLSIDVSHSASTQGGNEHTSLQANARLTRYFR
jgi:hypothetical protein